MEKKKTIPLKRDISTKKKIAFTLVAVLLPIFFLILFELTLHLCHYGHNLNLVIESPIYPDYFTMNKDASIKYFTNEATATKGLEEVFEKNKKKNTVRIFVLGESTTIGFPYSRSGSFHKWLKYRLMHSYPEKNFEVVNFSLTAVNSYTVLGFGKEIVDYKPDAVLVYVGHNEYVGALGVGSTSNMGSNLPLIRTMIWLRNFKTVQLLSNIINKIKFGSNSSSKTSDIKQNTSLMKKMVANQEIVYNSEQYKTGVFQFKTNLNDLCQLLSDNKIPTFVSNLVSNEKDLAPLNSINDKNDNDAVKFYEQGAEALKNHQFDKAKVLFQKARDYDKLRFRAPSEFNDIIAQTTQKYKGVYLVDSYSLFKNNSKDGILGNELILEHVHPNLKGYSLISDAFYNAMRRANVIVDSTAPDMSYDELLKQMPISSIDSLKGAYVTLYMKSEWPFNTPMPAHYDFGTSFEQKMGYCAAMQQLPYEEQIDSVGRYYLHHNQIAEYAKVVEAAILDKPLIPENYIIAAKSYFTIKQNQKAAFYLYKSFLLNPTQDVAIKALSVFIDLDNPKSALVFSTYLSSITGCVDYESVTKILHIILSLQNSLKSSPNDMVALKLSECYRSMGQKDLSVKYLKLALDINPSNNEAKKSLSSIK